MQVLNLYSLHMWYYIIYSCLLPIGVQPDIPLIVIEKKNHDQLVLKTEKLKDIIIYIYLCNIINMYR